VYINHLQLHRVTDYRVAIQHENADCNAAYCMALTLSFPSFAFVLMLLYCRNTPGYAKCHVRPRLACLSERSKYSSSAQLKSCATFVSSCKHLCTSVKKCN